MNEEFNRVVSAGPHRIGAPGLGFPWSPPAVVMARARCRAVEFDISGLVADAVLVATDNSTVDYAHVARHPRPVVDTQGVMRAPHEGANVVRLSGHGGPFAAASEVRDRSAVLTEATA